MSEHNITVQGGSSVRLPTAGKYCDRDIVVTAEGGGTLLPTLTNPATAADIVSGYEAIDGDGNVVEGVVPEIKSGKADARDNESWGYDGYTPIKLRGASDYLRITYLEDPNEDGLMLRPNAKLNLDIPFFEFGNAAEEDVAAGKTFTSASGLKVVGTAQGGGVETVNVTITINGPGTLCYTGADGFVTLDNPGSQTFAVAKDSPVIVVYAAEGGTYLSVVDGSGYDYLYGNAGVVAGCSCEIISFYEDGYAVYYEA